jgi:hypothetical protein
VSGDLTLLSKWGYDKGVVPIPLPRGVIKIEVGGACVMVADFFICAFLTFGAFVLVVERSSRATYLVMITSKPPKPEPCSSFAKGKFEAWKENEVFLGCT